MTGPPDIATKNPPMIVELVGLAGAGKTSLARALCERSETFVVGDELALRKLQHVPIFFKHIPFLLASLFREPWQSRAFTWDEMKKLVYLRAWARYLTYQTARNGKTILLDHGPIFKLATLRAFGPGKLKSQSFEAWWQTMYEQWARQIDLVIWVDATEPVLMDRIHKREHQRHVVKGQSDQEAHRFLSRYRESYEHVMERMGKTGKPALLRLDTAQLSIERCVADVLRRCESTFNAGCRSTAQLV